MFEVTDAWIRRYMGTGCCTREQMSILGEPWPMRAGWIQRSVGKQITDERRQRFEQCRLERRQMRAQRQKQQELF